MEKLTSLRDLKALDIIGWDIAGNPSNAQNIQLDYRSLYDQSRAELVRRIAQSTTWLNQNSSQAASLLAEVRVAVASTLNPLSRKGFRATSESLNSPNFATRILASS